MSEKNVRLFMPDGGMNSDDDWRVFPEKDVIAVLNGRWATTRTGVAGSLENVQGNALVPYDYVDGGTFEVLGFVEDIDRGLGYYFVWSSEGWHRVMQYNLITNGITEISRDQFLDFSQDHLILNPVIIENGDEGLLYWTDNNMSPRRLDVGKARRGEIGALTDSKLDVIKHPPQYCYSIYDTDIIRETNAMMDDIFQFSCRYIYDDFAKSRWSSWSGYPVLEGVMGVAGDRLYEKRANNVIAVSCPMGEDNVTDIEIGVRNGTEKFWGTYDRIKRHSVSTMELAKVTLDSYYIYEIVNIEEMQIGMLLESYDYFASGTYIMEVDVSSGWVRTNRVALADNSGVNISISTDTFVYPFTFDKLVTIEDQDDFRVQYDTVPRVAGSQALIEGNRLVYADILEGFNPTEIDVELSAHFEYEDLPSFNTAIPGSSGTTATWYWDEDVDAGQLYLVWKYPSGSEEKFVVQLKLPNIRMADAVARLASQLEAIGATLGWTSVISGFTAGQWFVQAIAPATIDAVRSGVAAISRTFPTLKWGVTELFGLTYYDRGNRSSSVERSDESKVFIPWWNVWKDAIVADFSMRGTTISTTVIEVAAGIDLTTRVVAGGFLRVTYAADANQGEVREILSVTATQITLTTALPTVSGAFEFETGILPSTKTIMAQADWAIFHQPPDWASHYQWVWGKNADLRDFGQHLIPITVPFVDVYYGQTTVVAGYDTDDYYYIYVNKLAIEEKEKFPDKNVPFYQFVEGDRLRVIGYEKIGESMTKFTTGIVDMPIIGEDWLSGDEGYEQDDATSPDFVGDADGNKKREYGLSFIMLPDPIDGELGDYDYILFEIYRPRKTDVDKIAYYEVGPVMEIGDPGLTTRFHKGVNAAFNWNHADDVADDSHLVGWISITRDSFSSLDPADNYIFVTYPALGSSAYDFTWRITPEMSVETIVDGIANFMESNAPNTGIHAEASSRDMIAVWAEPGVTANFFLTAVGGVRVLFNQMVLTDTSAVTGFATALTEADMRKAVAGKVEIHASAVIRQEQEIIFHASATELYTTRFSAAHAEAGMQMTLFENNDQDLESPTIFPAVGTLDFAECYMRIHYEAYDNDGAGASNNGRSVPFEFLEMVEHFDSDVDDAGRFNIVNHDAKELRRAATIRHGGKYFQQSKLNFINKFDAPDQESVSMDYGPISGIRYIGWILKVLQAKKVTSIYISRTSSFNPEGTEQIILTDKVFGTIRPYEEEFGTTNPESVSVHDKHMYFIDLDHGKIFRDAQNGLQAISDYKMNKFFRDRSNEYKVYTGAIRILTITDEKYDEVLVSFTTATRVTGGEIPYVLANDAEDLVLVNGQDLLVYTNFAENFTIAFVEKGSSGGVINRWKEFYSFIPEMYGKIGNQLISFKDGDLYVHEKHEYVNNFYGVQYQTNVEMLFNPDAIANKVFDGIAINSSRKWGMPINNDLSIPADEIRKAGMSSRIPYERFDWVEGVYYSDILRDIQTPGSGTDEHKLVNGQPMRGKVIRVLLRNEENLPLNLNSVILYYTPSKPF